MAQICKKQINLQDVFESEAKYKEVNGKAGVTHSLACTAGTIGKSLKAANAKIVTIDGACFPEDTIYVCSEAFKSAVTKDNIALRFEEISETMYLDRKFADRIINFVATKADSLPAETSSFELKGPKGNALITARDILLAKYIKAIDSRDTTMAGKPIPAASEQCFDNTQSPAASMCAELGKIIAANSLQGRTTTKTDIRLSETPGNAPVIPAGGLFGSAVAAPQSSPRR